MNIIVLKLARSERSTTYAGMPEQHHDGDDDDDDGDDDAIPSIARDSVRVMNQANQWAISAL